MIRIFLVGYMGAGKTTFGKALAKRLDLTFIDTDAYIENRFHRSINDIFATAGEEKFRDIEHKLLEEVAEIEDVVISTGGGLPCFHNNMTYMNDKGLTVFLDAPVEALSERLESAKSTRPVLQNRKGDELKLFISDNLNRRRPFYEQATIHIDTSIFDINKMIDNILEMIKTNS